MADYEAKYWTTLIQLERPEDKESIKMVAHTLKTSPSRLIGNMIARMIDKYESKQVR